LTKHWLTTLFGLLAAIGGALMATNAAHNKPILTDVAQTLQTVGIAGIGLTAADANKIKSNRGD
jgi:hypothetical protein